MSRLKVTLQNLSISTIPLEAAIGYAQRKWRIFPVAPRSKTPAIPDWPNRATHDTSRIERFWTDHPDYNIGLLCGHESDVVVVDLDPKSGGFDSWNDICCIHSYPLTLSSITGSGGEHHFFQAPEGIELRNTAGNIGPGIDTRAWHGYVVLPPSIHPNGQPYEWDHEIPLEALPDWLLERWQALSRSSGKPDATGRLLPNHLREFVANLCMEWGLKAQRNGEFAGPCPYPHLLDPCDCPQAFFVNPVTGFWRCFCSDHPKLESKLVATATKGPWPIPT